MINKGVSMNHINKSLILRKNFFLIFIIYLTMINTFSGFGGGRIAPKENKQRTIDHYKILVSEISNSDLTWFRYGSFNVLACSASKSKAGTILIKEKNIRSIPFLLEALNDNDKFIIAHMILTRLTLSKIKINKKTWNHLNLENAKKNPEEEKKKVVKFWNEFTIDKINPSDNVIILPKDN